MMALSPSTVPRSAHLVHVRAEAAGRAEPSLREPLSRLMRLARRADPNALRAAVLALLMSGGSRRERAAWEEQVHDVDDTEQLLDDVQALPPSRRLPWLEHLARALAPGPVATRHDLIGATRRVMTADGLVSPLDQLRWIALRHLLAGSAVAPPEAAHSELESLDARDARQVCLFSAFLSQMVPSPEVNLDLTGLGSLAQLWYDKVSVPWHGERWLPPRDANDIDAALRALRVLQSLPWMLRPVLVRAWFDAARELTDGPMLHAEAADALRLCCVLLDSPVPPELARQYIEVEAAHH
jgi:hypothetical protein